MTSRLNLGALGRRIGQGSVLWSATKRAAERLPNGSLHLFILFNLAIAQPLYDLLGRSAPFFVAERSQPGRYFPVSLTPFHSHTFVFLGLGVHGLVTESEVAPGDSRTLGCSAAGHHISTILKPVADFPGVILAFGAGLIGIVGATAYFRFDMFRQFLTFASIGVLVIPTAFVLDSDISKLAFPGATRGASRSKLIPRPRW